MSTIFLQMFGVIVGVAASAVTFHVPWTGLMGTVLAGLIGWEINTAMGQLDVPPVYSALLGGIGISLVGEVLARERKIPVTVITGPAILPLVPGLRIYKAMYALIQKDFKMAGVDCGLSLLIASGIATGLLIGNAIARAWLRPAPERHTRNTKDYLYTQDFPENRAGSQVLADVEDRATSERLTPSPMDIKLAQACPELFGADIPDGEYVSTRKLAPWREIQQRNQAQRQTEPTDRQMVHQHIVTEITPQMPTQFDALHARKVINKYRDEKWQRPLAGFLNRKAQQRQKMLRKRDRK